MHCLRLSRAAQLAGPALLALVALLLICQAPPAADPPANLAPANPDALALDKKILNEAKSGSEIMANLTYLSDVIGPRLTGSAALKRANEWTAEKMRSYGLTNVHLEGWTIPMGWERGSVSMRLIDPPGGRPLIAAALGWTPSTKGKVEGDVVILNAKNTTELAAYKGKLKDAIVLSRPPDTIRPVKDPDWGFGAPRRKEGGPAPKAEGPRPNRMRDFRAMMTFRRELAEFLRTEGAAVMVMDAGKPHGLLTMTGSWPGEDRISARDPLPSLFMAHEHYALLYRLASRPAPARTRVEVEITNTFVPGPIPVYNTVGEIKGSEKPDEVVVLGAHLDSWDLGQGTTDNGTGTSVVLEAARILARSGIKPKRTIRFILFTGEEQGLYGSRAYVKQHKDELSRVSMALVHDTGTGKVKGLGLQEREKIKPILEKELASLKELGAFDINLESMGGSDHQSFDSAEWFQLTDKAMAALRTAEVPEGVLSKLTPLKDKPLALRKEFVEELGKVLDKDELTRFQDRILTHADSTSVPGFAFQQEPDEYRFTHHSQSDTLDKAKEPNLIQGAQAMALIGLRVANLPDLLPKERPPRQGRDRFDFFAPPEEKKPAPEKKAEPEKKAG
jgi:hypothetical protein